MDLNDAKKWLGQGEGNKKEKLQIDAWEESLPCKFFNTYAIIGIHIDLVKLGRLVSSMKVPPCLANDSENFLHNGAVASLVDLEGWRFSLAFGLQQLEYL